MHPNLRPQVLDLNILVGGMIVFLCRTLGETVEILTSQQAGLRPISADPGQIENALLNLAINARDAMRDGGKLTIETKNSGFGEDLRFIDPALEGGPYVVLAVSDNGTGMPPGIVDRVFDPFFTTKEVGEGSSLGLSMVYGFIQQSGGTVKIESEVGRGTTVRMYLPIAAKDAVVAEDAARKETHVSGQGELILIVEDDGAVRQLAETMLRGLGYRTLGATDGNAGLVSLMEHPDIPLLLSNIVLPGAMSGTELAALAQERRPDLRVLFMSGYTDLGGMRIGRSLDESELIRKPFRRSDLAEKVRVILHG